MARTRNVLILLFALLALAVVACGGGDRAAIQPASTPEPTATPVPTPTPAPTRVSSADRTMAEVLRDPESNPSEIAGSLSLGALSCLTGKWGQEKFGKFKNGDFDSLDEEGSDPAAAQESLGLASDLFGCLTQDDYYSLFSAMVAESGVEIDAQTESCIRKELGPEFGDTFTAMFGGLSTAMASVMGSAGQDADPQARAAAAFGEMFGHMTDAMAGLLPPMFCFKGEQRAAVEESGAMGLPSSMDSYECVYNKGGRDGLRAVMTKTLVSQMGFLFTMAGPDFDLGLKATPEADSLAEVCGIVIPDPVDLAGLFESLGGGEADSSEAFGECVAAKLVEAGYEQEFEGEFAAGIAPSLEQDELNVFMKDALEASASCTEETGFDPGGNIFK